MGFLAYGLLLTLAWVLLHGVDVALTEAAIGGGLTGALLIGAVARLSGTQRAAQAEGPGMPRACWPPPSPVRSRWHSPCACLRSPRPRRRSRADAMAHIGPTGVGNPITAVLLAYRAMDTLLEAIVLVFALIGVWSLAPDAAWGGRPGVRHRADPDGILAYLARLLPPIGLIIGLYVFWVGADAPGGKFQGATLVAAMWLLVVMAGLADVPPISRRWLRLGLVAGPLAFIAHRHRGCRHGGRVPRLPGRPGEAAHRGDRARADAHAHADPRAAARRRAAAAGRAMTASTLLGLTAALLVGIGVYGLVVDAHPLRKILAFNVVGSGVFLLLGAIARRGAGAGLGGDPVPQALLITGIVVAFSATALAVAVLLRLAATADSVSLASDPPARPPADGAAPP